MGGALWVKFPNASPSCYKLGLSTNASPKFPV